MPGLQDPHTGRLGRHVGRRLPHKRKAAAGPSAPARTEPRGLGVIERVLRQESKAGGGREWDRDVSRPQQDGQGGRGGDGAVGQEAHIPRPREVCRQVPHAAGGVRVWALRGAARGFCGGCLVRDAGGLGGSYREGA